MHRRTLERPDSTLQAERDASSSHSIAALLKPSSALSPGPIYRVKIGSPPSPAWNRPDTFAPEKSTDIYPQARQIEPTPCTQCCYSGANHPRDYYAPRSSNRLYFLRTDRSRSCGSAKTLTPFAPVIVSAATIALTIASSVACTVA